MRRVLLFLTSLCLFVFLASLGLADKKDDEHKKSVELSTARLSPSTQACIACHAQYTPGIVHDWLSSRHSQATPADAMKKPELERRISADTVSAGPGARVTSCRPSRRASRAWSSDLPRGSAVTTRKRSGLVGRKYRPADRRRSPALGSRPLSPRPARRARGAPGRRPRAGSPSGRRGSRRAPRSPRRRSAAIIGSRPRRRFVISW